jgi:hypothetical protein
VLQGIRLLAGAYDSRRQTMVVVGVSTLTSSPRRLQTFEMDSDGTWVMRAPIDSQHGDSPIALAYDPLRARVVLMSGSEDGGFIWEFDGTTWIRQQFATEFAPGIVPSFATYDSSRSALTLFGRSIDAPWELLYTYGSSAAAERCEDASADSDSDGFKGCDDPDCWSRCRPECPPHAVCDTNARRCGDAACDISVEDYLICPQDCEVPRLNAYQQP